MEKLRGKSLELEIYEGSSLNNDRDCNSQIGYIISLKDTRGRKEVCPMLKVRIAKSREVNIGCRGIELVGRR